MKIIRFHLRTKTQQQAPHLQLQIKHRTHRLKKLTKPLLPQLVK